MEVLGILWKVLVVLYWLVVALIVIILIGYGLLFVSIALCFLAPVLVGIPLAVAFWQQGHDNISALTVIAAVCGQAAWFTTGYGAKLFKSGAELLEDIKTYCDSRLRTKNETNRCPSCGSRAIETFDSTTTWDTTTVTETDRIQHFNKEGEETGYSEIEREVPVEVRQALYHKRCTACAHTWVTSAT